MADNKVIDIARRIMRAHSMSRLNASSSTSYFDFDGNEFECAGAGRIALSNRYPANFQGVCDAVLYELVLQDQTLRLTKTQ